MAREKKLAPVRIGRGLDDRRGRARAAAALTAHAMWEMAAFSDVDGAMQTASEVVRSLRDHFDPTLWPDVRRELSVALKHIALARTEAGYQPPAGAQKTTKKKGARRDGK